MAGIGTVTLYSGFRLHVGGPFPTSRSLENRLRVDSADDAVKIPNRENGVVEQQTAHAAGIGIAAAPLLIRSDLDALAPGLAAVLDAYREAGETGEP